MNKILKSVLTAVASLALAVGFAVAPASAAPSPATLFVGGPAGSINDCSTLGSVGIFSDSAHTTAVTNISGTSGMIQFTNDCNEYAVYYTIGSSAWGSIAGKSFNSGAHSSSTLSYMNSDTFTLFRCARISVNLGTAGGCTTPSDRTQVLTLTSTIPGSTPRGPSTPTPSASPSPSAPTTAVGTAAALAELPKSTTAPKLKFDSSANGIGKSAKKSLKKVAEVAKDGYGIRVTGAAGMQPGVSKDIVKKLAKQRAMEIRDYLVKQGVNKEDIIIKTKIYPIGKAPATLVKIETLS